MTPSLNAMMKSPGWSVTVSSSNDVCSNRPEHHAAGFEPADARRGHEDRRVVPAVGERERAVRREHAVERRQEPVLDRAAEQPVIQPADERGGAHLIRRLGAEHPGDRRRQQRGRRTLARDVADDEAESSVGKIDVVEEVAADRETRRRRGGRREERAADVRRRQQAALNRRGDLQLLFVLRLVERLAIEPRVLNRERRFRRQHLERRARADDETRAPRSRLSR